jgi:hypothetical protein
VCVSNQENKRKEKQSKAKQSNKWVVGKRSGYYLTLGGSVKT